MDFLRELRLVFVFIGCTRLAGSDYPMDTKFLTLSGCARPNDLLGICLTIYRAHWDLTRPGSCTKPCQKKHTSGEFFS
ncbi:hypothetical protein HMPREF9465_02252 [Sutterella wadsworthensis 2_1_59BFAA]|uniref:Uncharacterized protein n=2 Tax=Sutterella wadsworthensis 2_1_59BFAA TaxID=742823 RepID=K1JQX6_9BURK|nr:hypothetical protein HMPREF9465_02252 [Sutterella wadsworthensis 2_1_59BFAA]